jgi:hypothetical protein
VTADAGRRWSNLDSPERKFINRILTGLRYSCDEAGGIIEDLDIDGALFVALSPHRPRQSCDKSCRSVDQDLPANKTAPNHFIARHAGEGASCCFHGKA